MMNTSTSSARSHHFENGAQTHPNPQSTVERFIHNASIASHRFESPISGSFTLFPFLPSELRVRIWHHAISVPRIVEMEKIPSWSCHNDLKTKTKYKHHLPSRWRYQIKNLPALLSTCSESREEVLKACGNAGVGAGVGREAAWMRYDYDILHLKARTWGKRGSWVEHRWFEDDNLSRNCPKREYFQHIQALAINRELFLLSVEREESILRHLFPNLKLLIVLIDGSINMRALVKLREEKGIENCDPIFRRCSFMLASTGPFTLNVCKRNSGYQRSVEENLTHSLEVEERKFKNYVRPRVVAMGCSLPPGMSIPDFDDGPEAWGQGERKLPTVHALRMVK